MANPIPFAGAPTPDVAQPFSVPYVEIDGVVLVKCGCTKHPVDLIIRRTIQFVMCPHCQTRYFISEIEFNAGKYYDQQIAAGIPPDKIDMRQAPMRVSIGRQVPNILTPGAFN